MSSSAETIAQLHQESSFVRARSHPALGGCFGPGCKVAYGELLAMDMVIPVSDAVTGYNFVGDGKVLSFGLLRSVLIPSKCSDQHNSTEPNGDPFANCQGAIHGQFRAIENFQSRADH